MLIFACRRQLEDFRPDLGFKIDHHAHNPGFEIADAHLTDIRIVRLYFFREALEFRADIRLLQVDHQTFRVFQRDHAVSDGLRGFKRDAGVIGCRPDARGSDAERGVSDAGQ